MMTTGQHLTIIVVAVVILTGCALREHGLRQSAAQYKVTPLQGQSETQRIEDEAACAKEVGHKVTAGEIAGALFTPFGIGASMSQQSRYQGCMQARGYALEFDPKYVTPSPAPR